MARLTHRNVSVCALLDLIPIAYEPWTVSLKRDHSVEVAVLLQEGQEDLELQLVPKTVHIHHLHLGLHLDVGLDHVRPCHPPEHLEQSHPLEAWLVVAGQ